jgi:hypothetical protein
MSPPLISRIALVALYCVGGSVFLAGLYWCINTAIFVIRTDRTEGEIVRIEKVRAKGGWSYVAAYSYLDREGHRWEGRTPFSARSFSELNEGQKVKVLFDPEEPMDANLDSTYTVWFLPGFITCWGGLFLFITWLNNRRKTAKVSDAI